MDGFAHQQFGVSSLLDRGTLLKEIAGGKGLMELQWSHHLPVLSQLAPCPLEAETLRAACGLSPEAAGRAWRMLGIDALPCFTCLNLFVWTDLHVPWSEMRLASAGGDQQSEHRCFENEHGTNGGLHPLLVVRVKSEPWELAGWEGHVCFYVFLKMFSHIQNWLVVYTSLPRSEKQRLVRFLSA